VHTVIVTPKALNDLSEMAIFYENISDGLGEKFLNDYYNTLVQLSKNPFAYFNLRKNKRRISFKTFQCMLIYEIKGTIIQVQVLKDLRSKPLKDFY
jgi:hypothetical protein